MFINEHPYQMSSIYILGASTEQLSSCVQYGLGIQEVMVRIQATCIELTTLIL